MKRGRRDRDIYSEIRTIMADLPCSVHGFCYHDNDGNAYIVLNSRLTKVQQKQTWRHEFRHIKSGDMFNPSYYEYI